MIGIKALSNGSLSDSKATLYTVPASTQTIVKSIITANTDSSARTLNIYVKTDGSNSRHIFPVDLSLDAGSIAILDNVITLEEGDLIEGDASVASVVDYVISGIEKS